MLETIESKTQNTKGTVPLNKWTYAFYLWLKRDYRMTDQYLFIYQTYEPDKLAFEAMLALAED